MSIGIVILNWNGKEDTLGCLASLRESSYKNFELIAVDNGSMDGSASSIQEKFPEVTLLKTSQNLGYAGGNNVGISYALKKNHSFVLLLNNDTLVDKDMLKSFSEAAEKNPHVGIFGGTPCLFSNPGKLDHLGGVWNSKKARFDLIGKGENSSFCSEGPLDYVCGCCILIRKEVFHKIGFLEPAYFLFWEETDFCIRAKRSGFDILVCHEAKLLHKVSASFIGGSVHKTYFWWRNRFLWIKRNCSLKERFFISLRVLLPELFHIYKLQLIKTVELRLLKLVRSKKDLQEKQLKIRQYQAALQGFHDYLNNNFGNGPEWIFRKDLKKISD
jgi:GT2 family glycosyltransferase